MRRLIARVTLSELASQEVAYPPWEIPVLELVHGGQVKVIGQSFDDMPVPSPEAEYARLERRFGLVKGTDRTRVSQAFGEGALGVQRLAEAMAEDLAAQAELDARPPEDREMMRLTQARERLDRDIASLERRRAADGSGPATYREPLGAKRVEEMRRQEAEARRNAGQGVGRSEELERAGELDRREQELIDRERRFEERLAALEGARNAKEPAPPTANADAPIDGGEQPKPAEDAADSAQPGRGRRRA